MHLKHEQSQEIIFPTFSDLNHFWSSNMFLNRFVWENQKGKRHKPCSFAGLSTIAARTPSLPKAACSRYCIYLLLQLSWPLWFRWSMPLKRSNSAPLPSGSRHQKGWVYFWCDLCYCCWKVHQGYCWFVQSRWSWRLKRESPRHWWNPTSIGELKLW